MSAEYYTTNLIADDLAKQLTGYSSIPDDDAHAPSRALRTTGQDWPELPALTMIGLQRMANIHDLTKRVLADNIPGDFMECGVWRGGASIYMRKLLDLYGDEGRWVILADSFEGFPETGLRKYPCDNVNFGPDDYIAVSVQEVIQNVRHYECSRRVEFIRGWFNETLSRFSRREVYPNFGFGNKESEKLALLRLDGDLYESTMDCLTHLYPRVTPGGYVIIDDYGGLKQCKQAVDEYRATHNIDAPITMVDWTGAWWRKP